MLDKHYVGLDLTGFEDNGTMRPISRVTLKVDDEHVLTAGDDTGAEITSDCPHATQAMVNGLLAQFKGYRYKMFSASDAGLDPAAELGDGITAGGVYSVISRLSDDGMGYPSITAPGEAELEEEFPTAGPMTEFFNRKIAETRSQITKTAGEIRQEVQNELKGLSASVSVEIDGITQRVNSLGGEFTEVKTTLDGLTITDKSGQVKIRGSGIDTPSLAAGSISADKLNLTGAITFEDLTADFQSKINGLSLPPYITKTRITSTTIESPSIIGGEFYAVDEDSYIKMDGDSLEVWNSANAYPNIKLRAVPSGARSLIEFFNGSRRSLFTIECTNYGVSMNYTPDGTRNIGFISFTDDGTIEIYGNKVIINDREF